MSQGPDKLDKFIQRFKRGDLGYCAHRLRKFNRRRTDAIQAAATVVREYDSTDFDDCDGYELVNQVLTLKDEMFNRGLIGRPEYANFILQCGRPEHRHQLIDEIMDDFAKLLKGDNSFNLIAIDDDCHTKNDFCGIHFVRKEDLYEWLAALNGSRGPLGVEIVNRDTIINQDSRRDDYSGWLKQVAVVRDANTTHKTLFVAQIGDDLTDALIKTIWLSTDNHLWNLEFENPKYPDIQNTTSSDTLTVTTEPEQPNNIHSTDTCRPNRANDLARAIAAWNSNKTDRSYSVAVWGIGVDAVFGKTVFVPASFENDDIKAMGPVDEKGNRFYVCHIDLPEQLEYNCMAYSEIPLSGFLQMVLDDGKAMGAAFNVNGIRFLVSKENLGDLIQKIGMLQNMENNNETKTK